MFNEGNQIHNFMSSSGSGTVINYGSGSDFLTSYRSGYGSGSTSQKVTVPTVPVPVPQHCKIRFPADTHEIRSYTQRRKIIKGAERSNRRASQKRSLNQCSGSLDP
jgi:hypothetical protein